MENQNRGAGGLLLDRGGTDGGDSLKPQVGASLPCQKMFLAKTNEPLSSTCAAVLVGEPARRLRLRPLLAERVVGWGGVRLRVIVIRPEQSCCWAEPAAVRR